MKFLWALAISFLITGCTEKDATQNPEKVRPLPSQSKITVVDRIKGIEAELKKADKNTFVVFDCDDVLTTISSHVWMRSNKAIFLELYKKEFPNFSHEQLLRHLSLIVASHDNILVSKKMPKLVDNLQQRGIKTAVLTAFSTKASKNFPNPMKWRIDTLKSLGYHFERSFPSLAHCYLRTSNNQLNSEYNQGIICCSGASKDDSLKAFLAYADYRPSKIIFIDDSIENVRSIEAFCRESNIDFVGIEYTESEKTKNSAAPFPTKRVEFQLKKLRESGKWISYEDAEKEMAR
ncbi:MAG: DUF2608 domain-containing protein [Puniceicoccales bacterium]|jgi:FMN phosphatase YigB (HAD superfamily)|nr:DUF2608 domain-containing protein [Puniceicoccales bacterium]